MIKGANMKYFLSIFILAISGWLIAANVHDLSVDSNGNMTAITKGGSTSVSAGYTGFQSYNASPAPSAGSFNSIPVSDFFYARTGNIVHVRAYLHGAGHTGANFSFLFDLPLPVAERVIQTGYVVNNDTHDPDGGFEITSGSSVSVGGSPFGGQFSGGQVGAYRFAFNFSYKTTD